MSETTGPVASVYAVETRRVSTDYSKEMKNVHNGVKETEIQIDDDGEISIGGVSFSKERLLSLYSKFLNTYDEGLKELKQLGIDLDTVESVSRLGISTYQKLNEPFYDCFDKNTVYLKKYKPVKIADNTNLIKVYEIIKAMSSAMLMMLHFSTGGSHTLFEMACFTVDNIGIVIKLYQPDDGKAYLYSVSDYSKKVLIVNDEVTKYFIHFVLALSQLKHDVMKDLPLDSSFNDYTNISNDVEINFDENLEHIKNAAHLDNAKDCLNRYVFCVPHSKNNGFCVGRMFTDYLKDLLVVGDNSEKLRALCLRRAFAFFKTEIGAEEAYKAFLSYPNVIDSECGDNQIGENNAVVENVSNIERSQDFHISFVIMQKLNRKLGFTKIHNP